MTDLDRFWMEDDASKVPGVTTEQIEAWEKRNGVNLPTTFKAVLSRRDGGIVRDTELQILSLDQIQPVDEDFWRFEEIAKSEAPDHALVFTLGFDGDLGGQYLINFNARGSAGQPSVYLYHSDGTGANLANDSLDAFLAELVTDSPAPAVDCTDSQLFGEGGVAAEDS